MVFPAIDLFRMSFTNWDGLSKTSGFIMFDNYVSMFNEIDDLLVGQPAVAAEHPQLDGLQDAVKGAVGANSWQLFRYIQTPSIALMVDFVLFDNIRGAMQVFDIPFVMTQA